MARTPRTRNRVRAVSEGSEHDVHDIECVTFGDLQFHSLVTAPLPVAFRHESFLRPQLEDLASSYLGWKMQAPAPKAMVRMGLEALSKAALDAREVDAEQDAALRRQWDRLPVEARNLLLEIAGQHPANPWKGADNVLFLPETIDWQVMSDVSAQAARRTKRGDYQNTDLPFAIARLIKIFVVFTKAKPTMNRDPQNPSPICKFARAFFAVVDPGLKEASVDTALDQGLRVWRRERKLRVNLYERGSQTPK